MRIIVTAGPTIEPLDPVRFISNRSTGYMGYQIAQEASRRKHYVTLISGPSALLPPEVREFLSVETSGELLKVLKKKLKQADCLIMCAAVCDFRPRRVARKKIRRIDRLMVEFLPTEDLLAQLSRYKGDRVFVGFSLETENLVRNSLAKLARKKLDFIVANKLARSRNIFGNNKLDVSIIDKDGSAVHIKRRSKAYIAHVLLDKVEKLWYLRNNR